MDYYPLIWIACGLIAAMTVAWVVQRLTGSSGWIDAIWSLAVGVGGLAAALLPAPEAVAGRQVFAAILVGLWSLRLAWHIAARTHGAGEDPRYADLARQWGRSFGPRLFMFLQIQAVAAFVLVVAVRMAATNPAPFPGLTDMMGLVILLTAIAGETVSDAQLSRFRRIHHGQKAVCDVGLWAWSRHPNYFFEWLAWCAWPVMALDVVNWRPEVLVALAAPVMMYVLLVHISGIPPLEAHMLASRGDAFRAYQARVSAFFPWISKRLRSSEKDMTS